MIRMGYDDAPPRISTGDARNLDQTARKILSQKKFNWAYEREWRVLAPVGIVEIKSTNSVIRAIYLGSRVTEDHKNKFLNAFGKSDIRIYAMKVDGYQHNWKILNPKLKKVRKR